MIITRGFGCTLITRGYVRTAYYVEVIRLDSGVVLILAIESQLPKQIDLVSRLNFEEFA